LIFSLTARISHRVWQIALDPSTAARDPPEPDWDAKCNAICVLSPAVPNPRNMLIWTAGTHRTINADGALARSLTGDISV